MGPNIRKEDLIWLKGDFGEVGPFRSLRNTPPDATRVWVRMPFWNGMHGQDIWIDRNQVARVEPRAFEDGLYDLGAGNGQYLRADGVWKPVRWDLSEPLPHLITDAPDTGMDDARARDLFARQVRCAFATVE